jgi:hypothetical protein
MSPHHIHTTTERWRTIPREHRVTILGSVMLALLGVLSSLSLTDAQQSSEMSVRFFVGNGFDIHFIAIPEKRVPTTGNNGTLVTVEIRNPGETTPLYSNNVNTGSGGTYSGFTITLSPGTYDITAKGYSHLRMKKTNQSLSNGITIDFTSAGTSPLLSGDVNGASGDNKVNGIDLTQIVSGLASYHVRYDLNRDSKVNGIDLTNAVSNLNVTGAS